MRYLPVLAIAIGVAIVVSVGLYFTKDPAYLFVFLAMGFAVYALPENPNNS